MSALSKIIYGKKKTDKPSSILGHNPQLPCINIDDVLEIQVLGQGAQGIVYKAHTKMIGTCAFKQFKSEYPVEYFGQGQYTNTSVGQASHGTVDLVRELKYSSEVDNHPNIVTFYSYATVFGMDKDNNPCPKAHKGILMEYMPGGSLSQYLDGGEKSHLQEIVFTTDRVHSWALQIARALAFCHNVHQIIHRDVKPSNILLTEDFNTVKLTDFGIARDNSGVKSVGKGTPQFQAPETYAHSDYDFKADVWSYGLLLYTMTVRRRPFDAEIQAIKGNQPLFYNHLSDDRKRPTLSDESMFKELNGIIKRCWKYEAKERPTMHQIVCQLDKSPVPKK